LRLDVVDALGEAGQVVQGRSLELFHDGARVIDEKGVFNGHLFHVVRFGHRHHRIGDVTRLAQAGFLHSLLVKLNGSEDGPVAFDLAFVADVTCFYGEPAGIDIRRYGFFQGLAIRGVAHPDQGGQQGQLAEEADIGLDLGMRGQDERPGVGDRIVDLIGFPGDVARNGREGAEDQEDMVAAGGSPQARPRLNATHGHGLKRGDAGGRRWHLGGSGGDNRQG